MAEQWDVVIIGSGPGGYVSAIRGAQLGLKVALVEKDSTFGGTCLNVGCIPSKALLDSSEYYSQSQHEWSHHGIEFKGLKLNLEKMMKRKEGVVKELTGGIQYLIKKNKITPFKGVGRIQGPGRVEVLEANEVLNCHNIVIATGSRPSELPFLPFDGNRVLSSTEALSLESVPKSLVVIGAGAIGLEMGSVWSRLGSQVHILEYSNQIGGPMDSSLSKELLKVLKKQGLEFKTSTQVTSGQLGKKSVDVCYESLLDGSQGQVTGERVLVAVGRSPFTQNLGLETVGVRTDDRGFVLVDQYFQTSVPGIYAIGDVVGGAMLAHKAEEEGVALMETLAGSTGHVNYSTVPWVIYTWPEVASVGRSEEELKKLGTPYKVGKFPFVANGRAKAMGSTEGQVKVLAHLETDRILGVHILGPRASDMIAEAVVAMELGASSEDLARSLHAHPTLSEALREAALDVDKRVRQM